MGEHHEPKNLSEMKETAVLEAKLTIGKKSRPAIVVKFRCGEHLNDFREDNGTLYYEE